MRKVIAAINMTINGNCDHRIGIVDEELHSHYTNLLSEADDILYGRITFQLMEYWRGILQNPTGNKSEDNFAVTIDQINKIVFSNSLKNVDWKTARLSNLSLEEEINELKKNSGKNILIGSRSLIIQALKLNLIDEFQLCIHPIIADKGLQLFENWEEQKTLKLKQTKTFQSRAIILSYDTKSR